MNIGWTGIDLHGSHTIGGEQALQTGLDAVSLVDQSGISSTLSAGISAKNGDWMGAALGIVGDIPLFGEEAKLAKVEKDVEVVEKIAADGEKAGIKIADGDKIDRGLLDPPSQHGNAPTFKEDGSSVEIHHEGQNAEGPYKEMHKSDHRLGENYGKNHSNEKTLTKSERKQFNRDRKEYWKKEYPKK